MSNNNEHYIEMSNISYEELKLFITNSLKEQSNEFNKKIDDKIAEVNKKIDDENGFITGELNSIKRNITEELNPIKRTITNYDENHKLIMTKIDLKPYENKNNLKNKFMDFLKTCFTSMISGLIPSFIIAQYMNKS